MVTATTTPIPLVWGVPPRQGRVNQMATMDEKLDRLIASVQSVNVKIEQMRTTLGTMSQTSTDHESRLRAVERWQNTSSPLLMVLTFVLGATFKAGLDRIL